MADEDTAQRGMGLTGVHPRADQALRAEAAAVGGCSLRGRGTDQLDPSTLQPGRAGLDQVVAAYREQIELVEGAGATVIVMASRARAQVARTSEDYQYVYSTLLTEFSKRSSCMARSDFLPAWPAIGAATNVAVATQIFTGLVSDHAAKVDGVKVSLSTPATRPRWAGRVGALPVGPLYTGDDLQLPGADRRRRHALL